VPPWPTVRNTSSLDKRGGALAVHRTAPSGATALLTAVHAGHGGDQVTHAAALGLGLVGTALGGGAIG
jgi:hypothetical protein